MATELIRLEVPMLPPAELSPNARGHWADRYDGSTDYEAAVFFICRNYINAHYRNRPWVPFDRVRVKLTIVFRDKRTRDEDNLRIRFKPGQDGLVKAQLVPDDDASHFTVTEAVPLVDAERAPLTIIEIGGERDG